MRKTLLTTLSIALAASALAGCTTTGTGTGGQTSGGTGNKTMWGAALGTALGATAGYFSSGNDDDRRKNALIGAGIGAIGGGAVGNYMDKQEAKLRQDFSGSGVQVSRQGDNIILTMPSGITFGFDKSDVQPSFQGTLNQFASTLNQYPSTFIDIVGHTDSVGEEAYNQQLSQRRAQAVSSYLVNRGVVSQRLVVRGVGEGFPIATNSTEEGRAQNRRVEILLSPVREGLN